MIDLPSKEAINLVSSDAAQGSIMDERSLCFHSDELNFDSIFNTPPGLSATSSSGMIFILFCFA